MGSNYSWSSKSMNTHTHTHTHWSENEEVLQKSVLDWYCSSTFVLSTDIPLIWNPSFFHIKHKFCAENTIKYLNLILCGRCNILAVPHCAVIKICACWATHSRDLLGEMWLKLNQDFPQLTQLSAQCISCLRQHWMHSVHQFQNHWWCWDSNIRIFLAKPFLSQFNIIYFSHMYYT
jgi:hypothetical protein